MRKTAWGAAIGKINVERGAESGLAKENVELRKLVAILVLYDAMVLSRCRNLSGTENDPILCQTNLQVHSRD